MKLTLHDFATFSSPAAVVIHSVEGAIYQITVLRDGEHCLLVDGSGSPVRRHNLQSVREILRALPVATITLRHESAYDEMIGQPTEGQSNALELALSPLEYPGPTIP